MRDSLFIIPHFQPLSTPFFDFFYNFFDLFLGRVHMDALTRFLYSFSFCPRFLSFSPTSSYNTNSLLHPLLPHLSQIIYLPYLRFGSKASILKSNHINPAFLWLFLAVFPVFYSFYFPSRSPPILFPTKFVTFMRI